MAQDIIARAMAANGGGGTTDAYTKAETNDLLSVKADKDNVYEKTETYTKTEVNTALNNKADKNTSYTKTEVNNLLANKEDNILSFDTWADYEKVKNTIPADTYFVVKEDEQENPIPSHNSLMNRDANECHPIKSITGLQAELDKKTDADDTAVLKARVDQLVGAVPPGSADEIADARVMIDGKTSQNLGDAIRTQVSSLKETIAEEIKEVNQKTDIITDKMKLVSSLNRWNKEKAKTGYINPADGTIDPTASGYKYYTIDVKPNDIIKSYIASPNVSGANIRFICAYDENGNVVPSSGSSTDKREFTVPDGIYKLGITIYASSNPTQMITVNSAQPKEFIPYFTPYYVATDEFIEDTDEIKKITGGLRLVKPVNLWDKSTAKSGYIDPSNGTTSPNATYNYNYIDVKPNDVVRSFSNTSGADMRFICAFDADGNVVSASGSSAAKREFTVPDGIYKLGITTYSSVNETQMITINNANPIMYYPYGSEHYIASKEFIGESPVKPYIESNDTFSNTIMCKWGASVQKNFTVCATMDINGNFDAAQIGFVNDTNGYIVKIRVTQTYVEVWDLWFGTAKDTTVNHGLTIANNLQIVVRYDGTHNAFVDIVSNGNKFSMSGESIKRGHLTPNLSITGTVSNVHFSVVAEDINNPIWAFGDSYFANYNTRWVSHLMQTDYKNNVLLDAYSGEYSSDAFKDLTGLLTQGKPKYILWCEGMNDGSDTDINNPSETWLENLNKVIAICDENEIELILATIPTVPTVNNEGKNKWVRNSGYQYVDFAKAVGASASGVWYSDMLSDDGIHPSGKGGLALYYQAITDFPQIMISK